VDFSSIHHAWLKRFEVFHNPQVHPMLGSRLLDLVFPYPLGYSTLGSKFVIFFPVCWGILCLAQDW
jgi:hypothetical protein